MTEEEKKALEAKQENEKGKEGNPYNAEADALNQLKKENDKLKSENDSLREAKAKYYDKVLNGGKVEANEVKHRTSEEIRKEWNRTASTNNNLKNALLSVELDDAVIRETGESSYLPKAVDEKGSPITSTYDERDRAERTSQTLKECLDEAGANLDTYSGGDPVAFNVAMAKRKL